MNAIYKRVLLKLSGEALAGSKGYGIDSDITNTIANEIKQVSEAGVQICIVIGGGNIFRGVAGMAEGYDRTVADNVGMLATTMNSLLLAEAIKHVGVDCKVLSSLQMDKVCDFFTVDRAETLLSNGSVVIISGGTGNPYFTTDTAAALRCVETKCDVFAKATKVDGIYDSDPVKNPNAKKIESLSHEEALSKNLRIMDSTAFALCMENNVPIVVFKLLESGNLYKFIEGKNIGSVVKKGA